MRRLRRLIAGLRREENGSVIVLVAVMITAIIGFAALATDVGRLYIARQRVVNVADAAALSGAQFLPGDREQAVQTVQEYLHKNGVAPESVTIEVNEAERTLTVTVEEEVPYFFARVLGQDQGRVLGQAVARIGNLSGYDAVAPLAVVQADWQLGSEVILKASPGSGGHLSPGNFGALALGGNGADTYEQNLRYGYHGWVRIGDWVKTKPGNMAGPTVRALQYRIDQDPYATFETVGKHSPRIMVIPVLKSFEVNGRGEVQVIGFATFFVEGVSGQGSNKATVRGRFLRYVIPGESDGSAPDFATYTIKLTR